MDEIKGMLMVIGGAEDKENDCVILKKFVQLSKGGRIIVMTSATDEPERVGKKYYELFNRLGARSVDVLDIPDRSTANLEETIEKLKAAKGVFFTGGDQLKITGTLGGTQVDKVLHSLYEQGAVIAGTSAGASVMSSTMIVGGPNDETPKKDSLSMAPGMDLVKDVVIDQHFAQRGRIGRLLSVVAQNPHYLGIGIDEDTAILINSSKCFSVLGSQTITVVNGEGISFSNVSETDPTHPVAMTDVILHVLPSGFGFDLTTKRPLIPQRDEE